MSTEATGGVSTLRQIMNEIDLGPSGGIQFMFAKLMLAQAMICKSSAEDYMGQIEQIQDLQTETADMISKARDAKEKGEDIPSDVQAFFTEQGLSQKGSTSSCSEDDWTYNLESLTNFQESIGNKTQTLMVYLQDFMSQYNSNLQGANSAIQEASQVLTSIATGR